MENYCIACGAIIPEGRQVCICCEAGCFPLPDAEHKENEDGD